LVVILAPQDVCLLLEYGLLRRQFSDVFLADLWVQTIADSPVVVLDAALDVGELAFDTLGHHPVLATPRLDLLEHTPLQIGQGLWRAQSLANEVHHDPFDPFALDGFGLARRSPVLQVAAAGIVRALPGLPFHGLVLPPAPREVVAALSTTDHAAEQVVHVSCAAAPRVERALLRQLLPFVEHLPLDQRLMGVLDHDPLVFGRDLARVPAALAPPVPHAVAHVGRVPQHGRDRRSAPQAAAW